VARFGKIWFFFKISSLLQTMGWTHGVMSIWVAGVVLSAHWLIVSFIHSFYSWTGINQLAILLSTIIASVIEFCVGAALVATRSAARECRVKGIAPGMFVASFVHIFLLALWMPYAGYSWLWPLLITLGTGLISISLASSWNEIATTWNPQLSRSHKVHA
jgi:hypothetical protein